MEQIRTDYISFNKQKLNLLGQLAGAELKYGQEKNSFEHFLKENGIVLTLSAIKSGIDLSSGDAQSFAETLSDTKEFIAAFPGKFNAVQEAGAEVEGIKSELKAVNEIIDKLDVLLFKQSKLGVRDDE